MSHVLLAATTGTISVAAYAGSLELYAQIDPPPLSAQVTLRGTGFPYAAETSADSRGRFRFRGLDAGSYMVDVFAQTEGEVRRSVTVSASLAGPDGRVSVTIPFQPSERATMRAVEESNTISFQDYCTPPFAKAQYEKAQQELRRRNVEAAKESLWRALKVAPKYSVAWNNLGTIAFQTGEHEEAERHFREALRHAPDDFSPLVNLGGALLALKQYDEALAINTQAHERRPDDALANAQLGMSYFHTGREAAAMERLKAAKKADPAHYTYPQLVLARIYSRQDDIDRVVTELQDFLTRHPDAAESASVRRWLALVSEIGDPGLAEVMVSVAPTPSPCDW